MEPVTYIVAIVVGLPVFALSTIAILAIVRGWVLKNRQLAVDEKRVQMEERLRSEELGARLLHYDDLGLSPAELASLADEVRRLREEVAQLRSEVQRRIVG